MPKSSAQRNAEYRRRLLAKARAWDHAADAVAQALIWIPKGGVMDARTIAIHKLAQAIKIAEQANG